MRNWKKSLGQLVLQIICSLVLFLAINIGINGMYLIGVPKAEDVQSVTISYPEKSAAVQTVTDVEHLQSAVSLTNFLRYSLFAAVDASEEPLITITYALSDGSNVSVSANRTTVWWKGKAHALKQEDSFVNLTEGIFYDEPV